MVDIDEVSKLLGNLESKIDSQNDRQAVILDNVKDINRSLVTMDSNIQAAHRRIDERKNDTENLRKDMNISLKDLEAKALKKSDVIKVIGVIITFSGLSLLAIWNGALSLMHIKPPLP